MRNCDVIIERGTLCACSKYHGIRECESERVLGRQHRECGAERPEKTSWNLRCLSMIEHTPQIV